MGRIRIAFSMSSNERSTASLTSSLERSCDTVILTVRHHASAYTCLSGISCVTDRQAICLEAVKRGLHRPYEPICARAVQPQPLNLGKHTKQISKRGGT